MKTFELTYEEVYRKKIIIKGENVRDAKKRVKALQKEFAGRFICTKKDVVSTKIIATRELEGGF